MVCIGPRTSQRLCHTATASEESHVYYSTSHSSQGEPSYESTTDKSGHGEVPTHRMWWLILTATSQDAETLLGGKHLGTSVMEFPNQVTKCRKPHPNCVCHRLMGQSPDWIKGRQTSGHQHSPLSTSRLQVQCDQLLHTPAAVSAVTATLHCILKVSQK